MEVIAKTKYIHQSPRKLRLVADLVRGLTAGQAVDILENLNKRASLPVLRVLKQGIGNAVNNYQLNKETLKIKLLEINEGPRQKRMDKSHRVFRWGTIMKKTSHVRLVLEGESVGKVQPKEDDNQKSKKKSPNSKLQITSKK